MDTIYDITGKLAGRFSQAHWHVRTGEQLGAQPICFVASRTKSLFLLALLSTHLIVLEKDGAKPRDIDELFEIGFKLAKRINRVPLPRGMQFGYAVMPMIIGRGHDSETLLYAASPPTMPKFCLHKFPVLVELSRRQTVFFEGYTRQGAAIWPKLQKIVSKDIEPVVDGR